MASVVLGNPLASGPVPVFSGNLWSGRPDAATGLNLFWSVTASGANAYIGYSGNMSFTSGGFFLSGGPASGGNDGFPLSPGANRFVPKSKYSKSGTLFTVFAYCDVAASGIGRLYYEVQ